MFRMFPVQIKHNIHSGNGRSIPNTNQVNPVNLQFTSKVYTISQIYNTKSHSCSSCGGGGRR